MIRPLKAMYARWLRFRAEQLGLGLRDWTAEQTESVRAQWENRSAERYEFISDKIVSLQPQTVLELGCGSGNVLYGLATKIPTASFTGIDISPVTIECTQKWFEAENLRNVSFRVGKAQDLGSFRDKSYDIVMSCAALMYLKPSDISAVLREMIRIAQRAVVLIEMHSDSLQKPLGEFFRPSNWKRNYRRIFNDLGISNDQIVIEPISERLWLPGGGDGCFIQVNLRS